MIRHAQTVENQHLILLTNNLIDAVLRFQLPDLKAVSHALFELLKFDHDSELSPEGVMQVHPVFSPSAQLTVMHSSNTGKVDKST